VLNIPAALKDMNWNEIKIILRGGKKDINVKFSTLESTLELEKRKR